jgi:imidazolonepropionase
LTSSLPEAAPRETWTMLRGARQLLTLRGASGPRRGSALSQLNIIKDGAILCCNGVIQEVGIARRIENLKQARNARVIEAAGGIVMPAFVDPDVVLVYPPGGRKASALTSKAERLRVMSSHLLLSAGSNAAADWARSGVLSVGAHTGYAESSRDAVRILRIHQTLQSKPLRIRSIFRPNLPVSEETTDSRLSQLGASLGAIRKRSLAAIVEFTAESDADADFIRQSAAGAAEIGMSIRFRITGTPELELLRLALATSAVSLISGPVETVGGLRTINVLGNFGCVHVLPAGRPMSDFRAHAEAVRREIDEGVPIAIAGASGDGTVPMNPQFLLYLAGERCGMSVEESIVASTYNAACSLRMSHVTGSLEPGKAADMLIMDVKDYRDLVQRVGHNDVRMAVRAGNVVYRRGALTVD